VRKSFRVKRVPWERTARRSVGEVATFGEASKGSPGLSCMRVTSLSRLKSKGSAALSLGTLPGIIFEERFGEYCGYIGD
jgi:hypothetical protein